MAITSYSELKTAVLRWTGSSDDSTAANMGLSSSIDDLITIGESRLLRETKTKDTEASISTVIASGVIGVPSDYLAIKFLYVNGTPTKMLEPRDPGWIYENYPTRSSSGQPRFFAREATNFIFGPYPDSNYTIKGVYYKKLAALSSGVNNLFTNNPDLYLFACLAESSIRIGADPRIAIWEQKYQKILADVNGYTKSAEYQGGNLRMRLS